MRGLVGMARELANRHILVVEDEPIVALDLADILKDNGAVVLGPASSVATARQLIADSRIDCAVLDVNLGHESVAPLVRELGELKIPFLFMTGYDEKDMAPLWRDRPILHKPVVVTELINALTGICPPP
jgi:DNA-binding response OmpR family regulator